MFGSLPTTLPKHAPLSPLEAHPVFAIGALFALALLVYWPILPGGFVMDDLRLVQLDNPLVNGKLTPWSIWFQSDFPLSNIVFWLQWLAWGSHPGGYHLVNIALHASSAVLIWRLLRCLQIPGAWLAAALFSIHPVAVNSVARVAELKNTLSLPFFLLSLLCYVKYEAAVLYPSTAPDQKERRTATLVFLASIAAFALSLLSKTSTVMLPVVLLGCALWRRGRLGLRDLLHTGPHFALALGFGVMSVWFQKHQALAGMALPHMTFPQRLILAAKTFWFYLGKALLPIHLNLVYPRWTLDAHSIGSFLPIVLLIVMLGGCWTFRRSWGRHVLFALGCFAVILFPALSFFDAQYLAKWQVSDHLQYVALIAPVSLASAAWQRLRGINLSVFGAGAALLLLGVLCTQQARVFASEETLMRDTLAKNPDAADAHNDLGALLAGRKDYPAALSEFTAAARCNPRDAGIQANLGQMLQLLGNATEAEKHLRAAVELKPADSESQVRLAALLAAKGEDREARLHLKLALRARPAPETRLKLAGLLFKAGKFRRAAAQFQQVLKSSPDQTEALNNLAWISATCADPPLRDGALAVRCSERACKLTNSTNSIFLSTLAAAYAEAGRFPEAIGTAEMALRLQTAAGEMRLAAINRHLLANYYRSGKAYHEQARATEVAEAF
jgi:protein O-mannosyl-transferase